MSAIKKGYTAHFILLSLLFVLGNACITAPAKIADEYNFLAFLAAFVITVAAGFCAYFIPVNKITLLPIWLLGLYCTADAFITFAVFIGQNLLPNSPRFLIILPLAVLLGYMAFLKGNAILKFSLISGVFSLAVIVFFFCSTAKNFNIKNIFIYSLPNATNFCEQIIPYFKSLLLPALLLAIFARLEDMKKSALITGLSLGLLCFGLCILNSVLLFGIKLSSALDYPYSAAGSVVTYGYLFTRLDGFLYFVYLATTVVKCAVGILVIKKSRKKMGDVLSGEFML